MGLIAQAQAINDAQRMLTQGNDNHRRLLEAISVIANVAASHLLLAADPLVQGGDAQDQAVFADRQAAMIAAAKAQVAALPAAPNNVRGAVRNLLTQIGAP